MNDWSYAVIAAAIVSCVFAGGSVSAQDDPSGPGAAPSHVQTGDRRTAIDRLLSDLLGAPTERDAAALESAITRNWLNAGPPAAMLLMGRGMRNLSAGAGQEAFDDFDAVIALDPSFTEAWHRRAMASLAIGDTELAVRDIQETLRRDPRHFSAWATLSRIAESRKDWVGAYEAWQKLMQLDPKSPGAQERLNDLKRRALGEET